MRIYVKLLALLVVVLTFGVVVGTASAGRISIDDIDNEIIWPEAEDLNFTAGGSVVECSATFLGSFHSRTLRKVNGSLVGAISHAVIGDCDGGTAAIDPANDPPWHVRFISFSGTLPAITGFIQGVSGQRFTINDPDTGAVCLTNIGTVWQARIAVTASGLTPTSTALATPAHPIDDIGGSFLCDLAGSGSFAGVGILTDLDGALITVRLI